MKKYLIFVSILISCSKTYNKDFEIYFTEVKTVDLKSDKVRLKYDSETFFSQIPEMIFVDSLLIINDRNPDYTMKIINLKNNKVQNFGKKGRGPNEFQIPFSKVSVDKFSKKIYIRNSSNYHIYSIDSLKKGKELNKPLSKFEIKLSDTQFLINTYCKNYIIGGTYKTPIGLYNIKTKASTEKYEYDTGGSLGNQANFFSHPSKPKVIYIQSNSEIMGIVTIKNDDVERKELSWWKENNEQVTEGGKTHAKSKYSSNNRRSFMSATTSENYIYILYSGKPVGTTKESYNKARLCDMIYVFDWEGNAIKKYRLDQDVTSIALDEKNNLLYASSYGDGSPYIVKYKLE
ncbi:BF3164 family lipoprotein [Flavivirga eckloniae]|uniref:6-bladed beta-propeller n=1 Tax=Flavivirga eckloniae TaxID=1803846 RepID=A0A2K9PPB7_9FLAO|nr:BF3164 family lipoprotein [Flavivirga eckloniae]AUP78668.1 hypothetical protein C1H87_08085 [Flavivirga eckloniae]